MKKHFARAWETTTATNRRPGSRKVGARLKPEDVLNYTPRTALARRLLKPRSVAIVGISPEPASIGARVYGNLKQFGYRGDIHLVSRSSKQIDGRPCVASVDELPEGIDAAVLAVPAAGVVDAIAACGRKRIAAAVVFAAGFAEVGEQGKAEQQKMEQAAHQGDVGLCGPNCIGFTNFLDGAALTFEPMLDAPAGNRPGIGIVTQSGAMQTTLRLSLHAKDLAVSYAISTGNEADLGVEDFVSFLIEDEATRVIVVFAEQLRHPRAFLHLAARARGRGKPIVLMHPGRSARARASALSHTGAMTGNHAIMRTLVAREGVVLVETLEELMDSTEILLRFPKPPVKGVGIITNSGAFKGYAIDFCDALGLEVPEIAPETVQAVKQFLPGFAAVENPLDTTAQSLRDPGILGKSTAALLADQAVGSAVVAFVPGPPERVADRARAVLSGYRDPSKPLAVSVFGDESPLPPEVAQLVRGSGACFIKSPDRALRAMARVTAYGRTLAYADEKDETSSPHSLSLPVSGTWSEYRSKRILATLGIPVPEGFLARELEQARQAAKSLGYPVALKAQSSELPHKTEAGALILGIGDERDLEHAWIRLHENVARARPGLALEGVLVEKMAASGIEMVVGARRDPGWGPVTMVGLGGIWIEALQDVCLLAPDLPQQRIVEKIHRLRGAALLRGLRGSEPADVAALARIVSRLGAFMRAHSEVAEVDINPLVVYREGALALDALLVVS